MNQAPRPEFRFWKTRNLPTVLQTETAECGLACLCMIASYWGHRIDLAAIRRRFSISLKGSNLKGIVTMARGLHLHARPLKLGMNNLPELKLPCILHWNLNHFVVLKEIRKTCLVIVDPALGERKLGIDEFSRHFTGVALELTPNAEFRKRDEIRRFSFVSLMGRVFGLKRSLAQMLILGLCLQICSLAAPFYMQWVVDEALLSADRNLIQVLGIGFLLLVLVQTAIVAVRAWITTVLATNLNFQWLGNTFSHLLKLPLSYFEKRHTGDVVSRFGSIQTVQRNLTTQFVEGVIDGALVVCTLFMMLLYSPLLSAVSCGAVLVYVVLRWLIYDYLREANMEQIVHAAKQQTSFMESIRGIQSIRLFNRAEERRMVWINGLTDQLNAELTVAKYSIFYQSANFLLFNAERVIVIWLAALAVLQGKFSVGMLFAFISYKDQFSTRLAALVDKLYELRMLRLHGERIADIVFAEAEHEGHEAEVDPMRISPAIVVDNVSFRYAESEPYVLQNLTLSIPAGQCVAITGVSGCGKTTLMKILLGLLEPTEGEILIDGIPLRRLGMHNYRRLLGTVMQDDTLFAGTLADNISFFDTASNREKIEACAALAAIHSEIQDMPMGYFTLAGDIGSGLSGGQRQRILLARALYKDPKILVLDEATSHLDVWNEQAVNTAIRSLSLTRIMVAHRPETIAMAERVVVLQDGGILRDTGVEKVKSQHG